MKTFFLNGRPFQFDESQEYYDFYLIKGKRQLVAVDFNGLLTLLETRQLEWNAIYDEIRLLSRWEIEAPRKRGWRERIRSGMLVLSAECFFEEDAGDKIIDKLENTGKVAVALCKHYNSSVLPPITNTGPNPVDRTTL